MTRHAVNQIPFEPRRRPPFRQFDAGNDSVRVLLVAIHRGPQPAAFLGSHPLQRLQVLLAAPGEETEFEAPGAPTRAITGGAPQILPQMPALTGVSRLRPRLVQGEILSDDAGRLYEKIGRHIRPLQQLFSGPRGEVLELPAEAQAEQPIEKPPQSFDAKAVTAETPAKTHADNRANASPERRQPPPQPRSRSSQHPGTSVLSEPLPPQRSAPNSRYTVRPHGGQHGGQRQPQASTTNSTTGGAAANSLKTTVPEQWTNRWEFQISREEALYDMRIAASSNSALLGFIRGLTGWFGHRQASRKWQALLSGKSLDEQLWAVRPPQGLITHPAIRDWARQTLEQAGYDARVMLVEWEIFWRRKGS